MALLESPHLTALEELDIQCSQDQPATLKSSAGVQKRKAN